MKELTYLHCQCFSILNISNNFFGYINSKKAVPCIFVVLSDLRTTSINIMKKLQKHKESIYPVIISDCEDDESRQFFLEFAGNE